jgi:site-specific DNA recombinase
MKIKLDMRNDRAYYLHINHTGEKRMKTAIGYTRISKEDENSVSLDYQKAEIKKLCQKEGFTLIEIETDEGISGKSIEARPAIQRVLQAVDNNEIDSVVVYRSDRISRDGLESLQIEKLFIRRGVSLLSVTEGCLTSDNLDDELLRFLRAGLNQRERKLISLRTRQALQRKKEKGERLGRPRFGFKVEKKELMEDPEKKKALTRIHDLKKNGLSIRQIVQVLASEGINLKKSRVSEILRVA